MRAILCYKNSDESTIIKNATNGEKLTKKNIYYIRRYILEIIYKILNKEKKTIRHIVQEQFWGEEDFCYCEVCHTC